MRGCARGGVCWLGRETANGQQNQPNYNFHHGSCPHEAQYTARTPWLYFQLINFAVARLQPVYFGPECSHESIPTYWSASIRFFAKWKWTSRGRGWRKPQWSAWRKLRGKSRWSESVR